MTGEVRSPGLGFTRHGQRALLSLGRPFSTIGPVPISGLIAYLRVAHIYMLISIPTDTSTIFGAFQAILATPFFQTSLSN